jgi:2',3'-cyclic-nucleotide 2'-phosphodiesterase (5'-nucleotidase family)
LAPSQTLTVDSGDAFAGSLFHLLTASNAYSCSAVPPVELKFLSDANFDATILGNHDFDGYDEGILETIDCARNTTSVPILAANIIFDPSSPSCKRLKWTDKNDQVPYTSPRALKPNVGITELASFVLKNLTDPATGQSLRVAIIGVFGPDSAELSLPYRHCTHFRGYDDHAHKINLDQYAQSVHETVTLVKEKHDAQVVILLAHSGVPEDEDLIRALHKLSNTDRFIDVHISSHTHSIYMKQVGKTVIHQTNAYGTILGVLQFEYDFETKDVTLMNKNVPIRDYFYVDAIPTLLPTQIVINAHIPMDKHYTQMIEKYKQMIDASFLKNSEFKYSTMIGNVPTKFKPGHSFHTFVADCLLQEMNTYLPEQPVQVFFMSAEAIRVDQTYLRSLNETSLAYQFSDVYRTLAIGTLSLDISEEKAPGDVIAHFYMSQKELLMLVQANMLANLSNPTFVMTFSNSMTYKIRWWGIPFINRMYDVQINGVPIESFGNFIHVAMPNWMTKYFKNLAKMTFGILSTNFRDKFGRAWPEPDLLFRHEYDLFARCIRNKK